MANAAAKKEAAAKKGATNLYFPLILSLNLIHLFLIYTLSSQSFTKTRIFITSIEWAGTYIAYQGILNDAEVGKLTRERSSGSGSKGGDNNAPLAGGIYLDVLGLIVCVQFGSIFIGSFIDWLLIVAPAIYGLMKWMNKPSSSASAADGSEEQDEGSKKDLEERRRKRAERRRQKRA